MSATGEKAEKVRRGSTDRGRSPRWVPAVAALLGSAWSAFLLPPQLASWEGAGAPLWVQRLEGARPYDAMRAVGSSLGVADDYVLFGMLVAPSFVLVGVPLLVATRAAGRWARAAGWLTVLGAPVSVASYGSYALGEPWNVLWGSEGLLLLVLGACAAVGGVRAARRRRASLWWSVLLASTLAVLVLSTVAFGYFPHGSVVGLGVEAAILAAGAQQRDPQS